MLDVFPFEDWKPIAVDLPGGLPVAGVLGVDAAALEGGIQKLLDLAGGVDVDGAAGSDWRLWLAAGAAPARARGTRRGRTARAPDPARDRDRGRRRGVGRAWMTHESIGDLLAQLGRGEVAAVGDLFEAYAPFLRAVVRTQLSDRLRAKFDSLDVVQSVWVQVVGQLRRDAWRVNDEGHLPRCSSPSPGGGW